jgi:hypothetical protein
MMEGIVYVYEMKMKDWKICGIYNENVGETVRSSVS